MAESDDSLRFHFDPGEVKLPALIDAAKTAMQGFSGLDVIRAGTSPGFWVGAANSAADLVNNLVNLPLAEVLVGAWKAHKQFHKYTDKTEYPPDKVSIVPLATHHVTSTHQPYIELFVQGRSAGKIPFELELDLAIEAGNLVIQDGRMKRIDAAKGRATGKLKCGGQLVAERTSKDFAWSQGISFGEGIAIETVF
jgi:hypothetical protein